MKKIFFLLIFSSALFSDTGKSGWIVLRKLEPLKPYPLAISGRASGELSGIFYNPAVASTVKNNELFFLGEQGVVETNFFSFLFGIPLNQGGLAGGVSFFDGGDLELYWMEGTTLEKDVVSAQRDFLANVAYGRNFSEKFSMGFLAKFAQSEIAEFKKASVFAFDVGVLKKASAKTNLSAALRNLETSTEFEKEKTPLPGIFSAGVMTSFTSRLDFGAALDYNFEDAKVYFDSGILINLGLLSISAGYRNVEEGALSFGLGIVQGNVDFGYKYKSGDSLEGRHILGVGIKFAAASEISQKEREVFSEEEMKQIAREYFQRATEFYKQGRYEEAIREWKEVLKILPDHEITKQKIKKAQEALK